MTEKSHAGQEKKSKLRLAKVAKNPENLGAGAKTEN